MTRSARAKGQAGRLSALSILRRLLRLPGHHTPGFPPTSWALPSWHWVSRLKPWPHPGVPSLSFLKVWGKSAGSRVHPSLSPPRHLGPQVSLLVCPGPGHGLLPGLSALLCPHGPTVHRGHIHLMSPSCLEASGGFPLHAEQKATPPLPARPGDPGPPRASYTRLRPAEAVPVSGSPHCPSAPPCLSPITSPGTFLGHAATAAAPTLHSLHVFFCLLHGFLPDSPNQKVSHGRPEAIPL